MPKYIAKSYLVHKGKVVQTGSEVELTKEQAERLGDKVTPVQKTNAQTQRQESQK